MIVFWETNRLCEVNECDTHASFLPFGSAFAVRWVCGNGKSLEKVPGAKEAGTGFLQGGDGPIIT